MISSHEDRPRLKLPYTLSDFGLDIITWGALVATCIILGLRFGDLPGSIATHYTLDGTPDSWGDKKLLIWLPLTSALVTGSLTWIGRYPETFNYLRIITPRNVAYQYRNGQLLLRWLKAEVSVFFCIFVELITRSGIPGTGADALLGAVFFVFLGVNLVTCIFFIYRLGKSEGLSNA